MIEKLFVKPEPKDLRLKMYIYGDTGTGKTVTSLQFPDPAVVDTQKGTDYYREDFDFKLLTAKDPSDPDIIEHVIDELIENPAGFKTFVVDSMTDVWDKMVQKRLRYQRDQTGDPHYEMQPGDWGFLKSKVKYFVHKLLALDMNIIATAESTNEYDNTDGDLKVIGTKPDGHKKIPYIFDVVLELTTDDEGRHWAHVKKDRTNTLPSDFEFTYKSFVKYVGIEGLTRDADINNQQHEFSETPERTTKVEYDGGTLMTAGITAKQLDHLKDLSESFEEGEIREILKNDYFVTSLLDLRKDEADLLIKQITN